MPPIRPADVISKKWVANAQQGAAAYADGVKSPLRDYAVNTVAANDAYKAGVTASIARDGFKKGVQKAGNQRWQDGAIRKGEARFAPGVAVAESDYASGFAPYREVIARTTLPPRGARRSPQNLQRMTANVQAISAQKEALLKGA